MHYNTIQYNKKFTYIVGDTKHFIFKQKMKMYFRLSARFMSQMFCNFVLSSLISVAILLGRQRAGLEAIKLEYSLRLKIKCVDWLFSDTCPQAANHCALF